MLEEVLQIGDRFYDKSKITEAEQNLIRSTFKKLTGKNLGACGPCYVTAYEYFKKANQKPINMKDRKFTLHANKLISIQGEGSDYNNDNITDEIAVKLLTSHPGLIKYFKSFPENWQSLTGAKVVSLANEKEPFNEAAKKAEYDSMSNKELKKLAATPELNLNESEYKNLNKENMVSYMLENVK